ncbi:hypothetical protein, partial [Streptomyces sp. adm13(2018)]|uniref:hypothetical protein n=1 Tax=Streptomyces sp. adm13(2018) TaxID=2479007 RepID=UPI001C9BF396
MTSSPAPAETRATESANQQTLSGSPISTWSSARHVRPSNGARIAAGRWEAIAEDSVLLREGLTRL